MAKRKRLTPPRDGFLSPEAESPALRGPLGGNMGHGLSAPISAVTGDASARAALEEVAGEMTRARAEGRMIEALPLEVIDPAHLVRDRLMQDGEEMEALRESLRQRGQQTPIEVVTLPEPKGAHRYGLISGWRRLTALGELHRAYPDKGFGTVRALVVAPESRQAAYVAMVEENEIRADLSLYERARIAMRAYHEGIYPTQKLALQGLFGSVSRSKRSKINSFIPLVERLDRVLKFPTAIPEKLGLELSRRVQEDHRFVQALFARDPAETAQEELAALAQALKGGGPKNRAKPPAPAPTPARAPAPAPSSDDPVQIRYTPGVRRLTLHGVGVDEDFVAELQAWLAAR